MPRYHSKSLITCSLAILGSLAAAGSSATAQIAHAAQPVSAFHTIAWQTSVESAHPFLLASSSGPGGQTPDATPQTTTTDQELADLKARLAKLEAAQKTADAALSPLGAETATKEAPFSGDWTWLNGNSRNTDTPMATKYFVPEFRADAYYALDLNHPIDDTIGGSSELFRAQELQLEQISFGGDIRIDNVRGRVLLMMGEFATGTPRNDASPARGQWDLRDAYRYVSEAWGGYHWNVQHGLNVDAGIFVSYIGLFSYYNFDNWAYQPSYVSSNTPWFFEGVRVQYYPTAKLKIEPWFINGWQSYGRFNNKPGLGGQIKWTPKPWLAIISNNYGMGRDDLGYQHRSRLHTDDSVEIKYYDKPTMFMDKMAFTFTGDAGCEFGDGVSCHNSAGGQRPKQSFIGYMAYNRWWFKKDRYALTVGGGQISNPGRYLALVPPINGADAISGTPYFTANPGQRYKAWDGTVTYDYMPSQFITFRTEYGYRHSADPYFAGHGGMTPPNGNNGHPADFVCSNGADAGIGYDASGTMATAQANCGGPVGSTSALWFPDLRRDESKVTFSLMVKF
jgi:hypothetical protein